MKANYPLAFALALGFDVVQIALTITVFGIPILEVMQPFITGMLYVLTNSMWPLIVFFPEELPIADALPLNTLAVLLAMMHVRMGALR